MGPERFELSPCELKARCAAVTPRPRDGRGIRFNRCRSHIVCSPVSSPKRSRTFVSALSEQRPEPLDDRAECDLLTRVGFEPNLSSLKDWQPHQKSNGPCCARTGCAKWVGRCLNPRLRIFSPPLIRLSYRPMIGEDIAAGMKRARCRGDTGLWSWSPNTAKVSQAQHLIEGRPIQSTQMGRLIGITPFTQAFAYGTWP